MKSNSSFTEMEIDTIGEIMNISMGSAATAVSKLLDKRVDITTPQVEVIASGDYQFNSLQPAIGVEINYISGIEGVNVMILKESDVKKIIGILLGSDYSDADIANDEMGMSAVCEVMNQMMGSSSTALSEFLGRPINISTPVSYPIGSSEGFKRKYFEDDTQLLVVRFSLRIDQVLESEFASVMKADFASTLVNLFKVEADMAEDSKLDAVFNNAAPAGPAQSARPAEPDSGYQVSPARLQNFDSNVRPQEAEQPDNLKLIMSVPLKISVEIGSVKKTIKDILEITNGSIIELNKRAGAQVDILVNGKTIAKGDVVIVEESYGVRITEILNPNEIMKVL